MATPQNAYFVAHWNAGDKTIPVRYNPKEFSIDKDAQFAEIAIPGLDAPLHQFVRGQAATLTVEIFFDTTDKGMGDGAVSVTKETDKLFELTKIEPTRHAPPPVTFHWHKEFPGAHLSDHMGNNQRENSFTGIVQGVKQKFTLFNPQGIPLRATVTVTLKEYKTLHQQIVEGNKSSPDRTHGYVVREGDSISAIAGRFYPEAGRWREIARHNDIEDPRRLIVGTKLQVPMIDPFEARK